MDRIDLKHKDKLFPSSECGLVLGNFDGVHQGHKALIAQLRHKKAELGAAFPLGAFCFTEPPARYFGTPVGRLTDNAKKIELFRREGLQFVIFCDFERVVDLSPEEFVKDVLVRECDCRLAVCGYNYTFGKHAAGTAEHLAALLGTQPGRAVSIVPPVMDGRHAVSSSLIRERLLQGHPEDAARMLGRPYSLEGEVTRGKRLGRSLGFPTANLTFPGDALIPAKGVYAVTVRLGKQTYLGISNVGVRPSFDDGDHVTCETHLFDFSGDLYGRRLEVSFLKFLRDERSFCSVDELREQLHKDAQDALAYFMPPLYS